ncbi:MAG: hypothetical protein QM667_07095 [Asticcacaulis sp.]
MKGVMPGIVAGLYFCLSACSPTKPKGDEVEMVPVAETSVQSMAADPSPTQPATRSIPRDFQGIWDAEGSRCEEVSDMKLVVSETGFDFWESHGEVRSVIQNDPSEIVVEAFFSGEGEKWTHTMRMQLLEGGNVLMIDEGKGGVRRRCVK